MTSHVFDSAVFAGQNSTLWCCSCISETSVASCTSSFAQQELFPLFAEQCHSKRCSCRSDWHYSDYVWYRTWSLVLKSYR